MVDDPKAPPQQPSPGIPFGRLIHNVGPGPIPRSLDFKDVYSNNVRLGLTPWDFTVVFALTKEIVPGVMTAEDQVAVRMSPQQFKTVTKSLAMTMKVWEEVFGDILETSPQMSEAQMKAHVKALKDGVFKDAPTS